MNEELWDDLTANFLSLLAETYNTANKVGGIYVPQASVEAKAHYWDLMDQLARRKDKFAEIKQCPYESLIVHVSKPENAVRELSQQVSQQLHRLRHSADSLDFVAQVMGQILDDSERIQAMAPHGYPKPKPGGP